MSVSRKIPLLTLGLFALVLLALTAVTVATFYTRTASETEARLQQLSQSLVGELADQQELAITIASQYALNPEIQSAFANADRDRLVELIGLPFQELQAHFNVSEFQFHSPPATVFLRAEAPEMFGEDQSATRAAVVKANQEGQAVGAIELAPYGLSARGIVPVYQQGRQIGSAEIGIRIEETLINELKEQYGSDWHLMVSRQVSETASAQPGPVPELLLQASSMANPIFAPVQAYTSALEGRATTSQVRSGLQSYALLSVPVRDQSGNVIGVIDIIFDQSNAIAGLWQRVIIILLFVLAGLIVLTFSLGFSVWYMLKPIRELTCAAQAIEKGDLSYNIPEPQKSRWKLIFAEDEIGKLAKSFKAMTQQFQGLLVNLERTVASRTRDLERRSLQLQVASEIARDVTMTTDLEQLLKQAVDLIRERFGLYYVGIFLLDAEGENARLAAATGEAGRLMLASGYRQKVGQAGLVGAVTNSGAARLVLNFDESTAQFRNTLLPDTQSEMALPLRIGEQLIGALDVQSHRANAFDEQDITTMQIVADQLTVAIENARLVHQLNETVAELEQAYGSYTQESWRTFIQQRVRALGYRYRKVEQRSVFLESHDLAHEAQLALHQGQMIVQEAIIDADGSMHSSLAVPMRLREQVIGVLNLRFESEKIDPEVASLIEEAAARVSLVLESARLLQEAQRLAAREAQINWIASQVRGAASLETILQNTVRELGKALGASRTYIHIGGATVEQLPPDVNGSQTSGNGAGADDNGRYPHRDPDLSSPPEGQPGDSEP